MLLYPAAVCLAVPKPCCLQVLRQLQSKKGDIIMARDQAAVAPLNPTNLWCARCSTLLSCARC
jgi:hypothetical protein